MEALIAGGADLTISDYVRTMLRCQPATAVCHFRLSERIRGKVSVTRSVRRFALRSPSSAHRSTTS